MARKGIEGAQWLADMWKQVPSLRAEELGALDDKVAQTEHDLGRLENQLGRFPGEEAFKRGAQLVHNKREELTRLKRDRARLKPLVD